MGNLEDVRRGLMAPESIRRVEIADALVDTGDTMFSMPKRFIDQLGLSPLRARPVRTSTGYRMAQVYGTVRLTVQGRECPSDVVEVSDECPVLLGQVPLELMDFVVDPVGQRLIGRTRRPTGHRTVLTSRDVTVHRGLSRFSRRKGRHKRIDVLAAKMGLSPSRRERGQVHVFGRRFLPKHDFPRKMEQSPSRL